MRTFSNSLFITGILLCCSVTQIAYAQTIKDIQEYCQSMGGSGMSDEDTKTFMDECIAEQSAYLEQESPQEQTEQYEDNSYEQNNNYEDSSTYEDTGYQDTDNSSYQEPQYEQEDYGQDQNCYAKVDEQIQKLLDSDPNFAFDYDQLIDQCLKGNL
tara:strand:- start:43119 stop:43586 length:468 start_codon:yes stop_codon:yes gene_type:complete